jgi:2-phospho-L-lactate guanylyltransferase
LARATVNAAVLPVKRFADAKQRLRSALGAADRGALVAAMAQDVLEALTASGLDLVVVVTDEPIAARMAREAGAVVVADQCAGGQVPAVELGIEAATGRGATRVLIVAGDCPALTTAEVHALLAASAGARQVVLAPDRHRAGTNALVLAPPDLIRPAFGLESFARHAGLARAAGAPLVVSELTALAHDVDTPADLAALRAMLAAWPRRAHRTRRVLEQLDGALRAAG